MERNNDAAPVPGEEIRLSERLAYRPDDRLVPLLLRTPGAVTAFSTEGHFGGGCAAIVTQFRDGVETALSDYNSYPFALFAWSARVAHVLGTPPDFELEKFGLGNLSSAALPTDRDHDENDQLRDEAEHPVMMFKRFKGDEIAAGPLCTYGSGGESGRVDVVRTPKGLEFRAKAAVLAEGKKIAGTIAFPDEAVADVARAIFALYSDSATALPWLRALAEWAKNPGLRQARLGEFAEIHPLLNHCVPTGRKYV